MVVLPDAPQRLREIIRQRRFEPGPGPIRQVEDQDRGVEELAPDSAVGPLAVRSRSAIDLIPEDRVFDE